MTLTHFSYFFDRSNNEGVQSSGLHAIIDVSTCRVSITTSVRRVVTQLCLVMIFLKEEN